LISPATIISTLINGSAEIDEEIYLFLEDYHWSIEAHKLLDDLGIEVMTGRRVTGVDAHGVMLDRDERIDADLKVWAAGIKAPEFLKDIAGLETNRLNQLVVRATLQTTRDDAIFAFGDCAAAPLAEGKTVPPRAQAAHRQASLLARSIAARVKGRPIISVSIPRLRFARVVRRLHGHRQCRRAGHRS
jgi:NADH dehydrogenase FAD-containing subunit